MLLLRTDVGRRLGRSARIVVLEDEPRVLEGACEALNLLGYQALGYDHPDRLDELCESVDLFVLDLGLPRRTGVQMAEMFRSTGYPRTPMIAIADSITMAESARESGLFQAVLLKPFLPEELLRLVGRC